MKIDIDTVLGGSNPVVVEFRSPFKGRKWWKRLHEKIFNLILWVQEFYEENLCYLFPCYGIVTDFRPDRDRIEGAG